MPRGFTRLGLGGSSRIGQNVISLLWNDTSPVERQVVVATNHSYIADSEFRSSPSLPVVLAGLLVGVIPVAWVLIAVAAAADAAWSALKKA